MHMCAVLLGALCPPNTHTHTHAHTHTHTHTHTQLTDDWNVDAESYKFTKLDPDNEEDRKTINRYLTWEGFDVEIADGKIFK